MWGKWVFPTSQDPLHHPLNYGCRLFPVKKGLVDLVRFVMTKKFSEKITGSGHASKKVSVKSTERPRIIIPINR